MEVRGVQGTGVRGPCGTGGPGESAHGHTARTSARTRQAEGRPHTRAMQPLINIRPRSPLRTTFIIPVNGTVADPLRNLARVQFF